MNKFFSGLVFHLFVSEISPLMYNFHLTVTGDEGIPRQNRANGCDNKRILTILPEAKCVRIFNMERKIHHLLFTPIPRLTATCEGIPPVISCV